MDISNIWFCRLRDIFFCENYWIFSWSFCVIFTNHMDISNIFLDILQTSWYIFEKYIEIYNCWTEKVKLGIDMNLHGLKQGKMLGVYALEHYQVLENWINFLMKSWTKLQNLIFLKNLLQITHLILVPQKLGLCHRKVLLYLFYRIVLANSLM